MSVNAKDLPRSPIPWAPTLPSGWETRRLKFLFRREQRTPRDDDGVVTAFRDGQVALRERRRIDGYTNSLQEVGYQGVRRGDLVIHAMDAFAGAIGASEDDGKSTPVYAVCTPKSGHIDTRYYAILLRHMALSGFVTALARGVRERSTEFRWADAGEVLVPLPSATEQTAIVAFVDRETAKIDALVEEQRRLIELLKEKRQAIISLAVTKGLDPTAKMKPSGVEWLGDVPEHWDVARCGYRYEVQLGRMLNDERSRGDDLRQYLRVLDVQWGHINVEDLPMMDFPEEARQRYRLRPGDLLVNEGGSYVGRSAIWNGELDECYYQKALHRLRPRDAERDTADFLLWIMEAATTIGAFIAGGNQTTIDHLTAEQLRGERFPFPPLEEQRRIAVFLNELTGRLASLENEANAAISLLSERRSALISAAVTGKFDVTAIRSDAEEAA